MSTQRREDRWQRTSCTPSAGAFRPSGDGLLLPGRRALGHGDPAPNAQHGRAQARVGTAPPARSEWLHPSDLEMLLRASDWLATDSLQSDCRTTKLVQLVRIVQFVLLVEFFLQLAASFAVREKLDQRHKARSASPSWDGLSAATGTRTALAASLSSIPFPSGFFCLHPPLPQFPAGKRRCTERHDDKGNLHLLNAA